MLKSEDILGQVAKRLRNEMKEGLDFTTLLPYPQSEVEEIFGEFPKIQKDITLEPKQKLALMSVPSLKVIKNFIRKAFLETETPFKDLLYMITLMHKFLRKTDCALTSLNWRPLCMVTLKVVEKWTLADDHLGYADLTTIYPKFSPEEYYNLEMEFLEFIEYDHAIESVETHRWFSVFEEELGKINKSSIGW